MLSRSRGSDVAQKASALGLKTKPWVKTSLAPGSKVVSDYLDAGGLTPFLDQRLDKSWREELTRECREGNVYAVGISAMTGLQIRGGIEAAETVRAAFSAP